MRRFSWTTKIIWRKQKTIDASHRVQKKKEKSFQQYKWNLSENWILNEQKNRKKREWNGNIKKQISNLWCEFSHMWRWQINEIVLGAGSHRTGNSATHCLNYETFFLNHENYMKKKK